GGSAARVRALLASGVGAPLPRLRVGAVDHAHAGRGDERNGCRREPAGRGCAVLRRAAVLAVARRGDLRVRLEGDPMAGRSSYVLVVDDDAGVRDVIVEILRSEGYRAEEARDGREALAV